MAAQDLSILLKCTNVDLLKTFLHSCVDELTGKTVDFTKINNGSDIEWSKEECETSRRLVCDLYKDSVINNDIPDAKLKDLPVSLQEAIKNCYNIRKKYILQAVLFNNLIKNDQKIVENIDWKIKWVLGSSKLVTISEPLLQLDFNCLQNNDNKRSVVNCEMNLEQINEFITELNRVKTELDSLNI